MPPELLELWYDVRACYEFVYDYFDYIPRWIRDKDVMHEMPWTELPFSAYRAACLCATARQTLRDETSKSDEE